MNEPLPVLISSSAISARLQEVSDAISSTYAGQHLTILCVLKGAFVFTADLIRLLKIPVTIEFIGISSYHGKESSGKFKISNSLTSSLDGCHVLICEDIIDTGRTVQFIYEQVLGASALSVKLCTFLSKPSRHEIKHEIDFVGFEIDDKFVVGYGLDLEGKYRELPYLAELQ